MRETYNIKDLERISGIKAHTIRIWEKRYNVFSPTRTGTNIREYCQEDLRKIITFIQTTYSSRLFGVEKQAKC